MRFPYTFSFGILISVLLLSIWNPRWFLPAICGFYLGVGIGKALVTMRKMGLGLNPRTFIRQVNKYGKHNWQYIAQLYTGLMPALVLFLLYRYHNPMVFLAMMVVGIYPVYFNSKVIDLRWRFDDWRFQQKRRPRPR